jgi:hypothetical protein
VQIGTADPAHQSTYQDLASEGFGFGYRIDDDAGIAHYRCSHYLVSLFLELKSSE